MANMGLDFKSPKKDDLKAWEHMQSLYVVGITFHSCGCSGPGYIPATTEKLIEYLQSKKDKYITDLRFWLKREEPITKKELEEDKTKNAHYRWAVPRGFSDKKGRILNADAIKYWTEKIEAVDESLSKLLPVK